MIQAVWLLRRVPRLQLFGHICSQKSPYRARVHLPVEHSSSPTCREELAYSLFVDSWPQTPATVEPSLIDQGWRTFIWAVSLASADAVYQAL